MMGGRVLAPRTVGWLHANGSRGTHLFAAPKSRFGVADLDHVEPFEHSHHDDSEKARCHTNIRIRPARTDQYEFLVPVHPRAYFRPARIAGPPANPFERMAQDFGSGKGRWRR